MDKENREISLLKSQNILKKIEEAYNPYNKLSDRMVAKIIGLAPATYNQIKNGSRVLGLDSMVSIERKTGIPLSQLLKLAETENYSKIGGYRWINSLSYEKINHENEFYIKIFQGLMEGKSPKELETLLNDNGYRTLPFVESYLQKVEAGSIITPEERASFFNKAAYAAVCSKGIRLLIGDSNVKKIENHELQKELLEKIKKQHPAFHGVKVLINPLHEDCNNIKFSLMPVFLGKYCSYYIKTFLNRNLDKRYIGLAGGFSIFNFVNQIFNRDDIFPPAHYHTNYTLVPLFLEPFGEFKSYISESIVSNLFLA